MINKTTLRLGNWIEYASDGSYWQVIGIDAMGLTVKNSEEEVWIEIYEFTEIPLTPAILRACGFTFSNVTWKRGDIELNKLKEDSDLVGFNALEIKSVHQLQNLIYAISGEELEINL